MSNTNIAISFPETKTGEIVSKITETKALFPVLVPPSTGESKRLQTIAEGREPYVAEAFNDAAANPQTVPGTVTITEWSHLEEQGKALNEAESHLQNLLELVQATKAVVGDARYENARRYYKYLQDGADKLPGAQTIADKLGRLFNGQGKSAKKNTPAPK